MSAVTFLFVIVVSTLMGTIVPWHPLGVLIGVLIVAATWLQDRSVYTYISSSDDDLDDSNDVDLEEIQDTHLETDKKEYRNCPVPSCGKSIVVNKDGTLRTHGPKGNRCPGLVVETTDPDQLVMDVVTIPVIKGDPEADKIVNDLRQKKESKTIKKPTSINTDKSEYTPSTEEEKELQEREEEVKNGDYTVYATPEDVIKDLVSSKLLPLNDEEKEELNLLRDYMNIQSLGDRPAAPSTAKLQRLIELESRVTLSSGQN